jgi:hypothetical protein
MNQPIDLRELLRETRDAAKDCSFIIAAWLSNPRERPDLESSARIALKRWLKVEPKLSDAALAQSPDAKPVCWINRGDFEAMQDHQFKSCLVWATEDEFHKARMPLYAAPQPPAGKSEPVAFMAGVAKDFLNDCTQSKKLAEEWRQAGLCVIPLYEAPPDAIPREIHERLIAEKDRELEWWAVRYKLKLGPSEWNEAVNAYASEHERDG